MDQCNHADALKSKRKARTREHSRHFVTVGDVISRPSKEKSLARGRRTAARKDVLETIKWFVKHYALHPIFAVFSMQFFLIIHNS